MMIALSILKIVLFTVLYAFLGLLALLLLLIFLPFVYKGNFSYQDEAEGSLSIRWGFGFFSAKIAHPAKESRLTVRICGFKIFPRKKNDDVYEDTELEESPSMDGGEESYTSDLEIKETRDIDDRVASPGQSADSEKVETREKDIEASSDIPVDDERPHEGIFERILSVLKKIRLGFNSICAKIRKVSFSIEKITDFLKRESTKNATALIWAEAGYFLRKIAPKKWRLRLHFGFRDPADTGELTGALCTAKPIVGNHVVIQPEFHKEVFDMDLYMRGALQLYILIVIFCKLYFSKDIKRFRHDLIKLKQFRTP